MNQNSGFQFFTAWLNSEEKWSPKKVFAEKVVTTSRKATKICPVWRAPVYSGERDNQQNHKKRKVRNRIQTNTVRVQTTLSINGSLKVVGETAHVLTYMVSNLYKMYCNVAHYGKSIMPPFLATICAGWPLFLEYIKTDKDKYFIVETELELRAPLMSG